MLVLLVLKLVLVVPYIGTWIETTMKKKHLIRKSVVPYIGTWIETRLFADHLRITLVVPYIGTWIETLIILNSFPAHSCRTLYRYVDWNSWTAETSTSIKSRTLYRYVDWNLAAAIALYMLIVVPYIGTWIETAVKSGAMTGILSRTLYRYVDWNPLRPNTSASLSRRTLYRYVDWND